MQFTISLVQMDVATADPQRNLDKAAVLAARAREQGADMIMLPELWTTGFQWRANARLAQDHDPLAARTGELAKRLGVWLGGSMLAPTDDGRPANAFMLFDPQGRIAAEYHKVHLFGRMGEDRHVTPGRRPALADTPWGPMGMAVCYDLRFPELFGPYAAAGARVVLVPAAWPKARRDHWDLLLRARAVENQCYVAGINQTGVEPVEGGDGEYVYGGGSAVYGPWGETLVMADESGGEQVLTVKLDLDRVDKVRESFPVLTDRRPDAYAIG